MLPSDPRRQRGEDGFLTKRLRSCVESYRRKQQKEKDSKHYRHSLSSGHLIPRLADHSSFSFVIRSFDGEEMVG